MSSPSSELPGAQGPLAGLRVIDWTHVLAGPFTGYQLALLGAEVIRIERADGDDMIRTKSLDPHLAAQGLGDTFVAQGGGKQSLAIDARDPRSQRALHALIASADVLVENFRPGKLASLGFDPAELIRRHPRLTVCSITGFGPGSDQRAYDHVIQAASGLMQANASADGTPQRIGFPIVDYAVGQQAALAIMTALLRRERTVPERRTQGEWLQVSMLNAALTLMAPVYASELVSGHKVPRSRSTAFSGSPLSGTFAVRDGHLAIVCNAQDQALGLMAALRDAGVTEADVQGLARVAGEGLVDEAQQKLGGWLARDSGAVWLERLGRHGVPAAIATDPIQAVRAACHDWPEVDLPTAGGATRRIRVPGIGFASTEPVTGALRPPPRRGEHSRRWLESAGLEKDDIDRLFQEGKAHGVDA
jgi:crotonobetainyl-CoA:carnitine CoA-transferase CaiB-like acyl-CoA transferase